MFMNSRLYAAFPVVTINDDVLSQRALWVMNSLFVRHLPVVTVNDDVLSQRPSTLGHEFIVAPCKGQ